jgi:hypothetical protein
MEMYPNRMKPRSFDPACRRGLTAESKTAALAAIERDEIDGYVGAESWMSFAAISRCCTTNGGSIIPELLADPEIRHAPGETKCMSLAGTPSLEKMLAACPVLRFEP